MEILSEALQEIKYIIQNFNCTPKEHKIWFRYKTPDEFIYKNQEYQFSDEASSELRLKIKKLIKMYIREYIGE